jgi:hypothetical protein
MVKKKVENFLNYKDLTTKSALYVERTSISDTINTGATDH